MVCVRCCPSHSKRATSVQELPYGLKGFCFALVWLLVSGGRGDGVMGEVRARPETLLQVSPSNLQGVWPPVTTSHENHVSTPLSAPAQSASIAGAADPGGMS